MSEYGGILDQTERRECPVCGERVLWTEKIPENPDPEHKPHCRGKGYVHDAEQKEPHRVNITKMCQLWQDGTSDHYLEGGVSHD